MAKDNDRKTTPATPATTPKPSFEGGTVPKTFDPKDLGTKIFSDTERVYNQGPKVNPFSDYTPFSTETQTGIAQGIADSDAIRSGPMAGVAKGDWLGGGGNPYLNEIIRMTNENTSNDVNSTFASNGRFGSDIHAEGLGKALAGNETTARYNNFNDEWNRMTGAQDAIAGADATRLGYSGMLDSKAKEKTIADQASWDATNNKDYNHLAKYLGLLRGGDAANETNKPLSFWDLLGTIGQTAGNFL